ncbi:hypothetical protein DSECCO2_337560 [anaerobic digester metagenome]|nr:hypothetical protein NQU17_11355 [Clostridiaceae bacterium HFYG-1003]
MSEFIRNENTSWEVLNERVAVKSTDLSALKYNEIRITNEVKDYFPLINMEKHERREIYLHYLGVAYPCAIYLDSYDKGRGKLRWGRKFKSVFSDLVAGYFFEGTDSPSVPLLRFEKLDDINYAICLIFVREIIENTLELDERVLTPRDQFRAIEENFMWRIETMKYHGTRCALCGFDYIPIYGDAGKGRTQIHLRRFSREEGFHPDVEKDLIPVCANCHDILHAGIETEELESLVRRNREMGHY